MKGTLLLLLLFTNLRALCCSCTGKPNDSNGEMNLEWLSRFPVVFTAKIDSVISPVVDEQGMPKSFDNFFEDVYLSTDIVYKGQVPAHLKINPPHYGSSCEFRLKGKQGKTYIFYGIPDEDGSIYTHFCMGSGELLSLAQLDTLKTYWVDASKREILLLSAWNKNRNGRMTFKYSNGQTMGGGRLNNGNQEGLWTCYNYYGKMTSKGNYENGYRSGVWEEHEYLTDYNSRLKKTSLITALNQTGHYVRGVRTGEWTEYRYKSVKKLVHGKMKTVEVAYPTEKGMYVNGMKEGDWISFDQDGKVKETIRYKEGDEVH